MIISRSIHVAANCPALVLIAKKPELPPLQPLPGRRAVLKGGPALAFPSPLTLTLCGQDPHVPGYLSESRVWLACLVVHFTSAARLPLCGFCSLPEKAIMEHCG